MCIYIMHTYKCLSICIRIYVHIYFYIFCMYIPCICIHIYIYAYTHIYTYIQIRLYNTFPGHHALRLNQVVSLLKERQILPDTRVFTTPWLFAVFYVAEVNRG